MTVLFVPSTYHFAIINYNIHKENVTVEETSKKPTKSIHFKRIRDQKRDHIDP